MNGLLPHVVRHAVVGQTVFAASQSLGLVTLALVIILMLEREALVAGRVPRARLIGLSVIALPLLLGVALTIAARLAVIAR
jgi:hypothetical protein